MQGVTNICADRISKGHEGVVLVSQGMMVEARRAFEQKFPDRKEALVAKWKDDPGGKPEMSGDKNDTGHPDKFVSDEELKHGMINAIDCYPLIETALRARYGVPMKDHMAKVNNLMSNFSKVAASDHEKDYAWIPKVRTPEEIGSPTGTNRYVGYPYTKYMVANDNIDAAAAWLMCSVRTAKRLGIAPEKWVYIHSGAQAHEGSDEKWFLPHRADLSKLPGMEAAITNCFEASGASVDQVKYLDLYSCFPCVVQIAADTLGMKHDDPRGFTITGGLPFAGQFACSAGALTSMMDRLRNDRTAFGLVTGNGGVGQEHSAGLYSAQPPKQLFKLPDVYKLQATVDAKPTAKVNFAPSGRATVEAFTVHHNPRQHGKDRGENMPTRGVIIGRLESGERFVANTVKDPAVYKRMMETDVVGAKGTVSPGTPGRRGEPNIFTFDD